MRLYWDQAVYKKPGNAEEFPFHQDNGYTYIEPQQYLTCWVALTDADEHNGCFRVIRGSHRRGLLPGLEDDGELGPLFTDPRHFDESQQVPAIAPAGSLVFFSPHTVHGSEPNKSDDLRRAMVITYQPGGKRMFKVDAVRDAGRPGASA